MPNLSQVKPVSEYFCTRIGAAQGVENNAFKITAKCLSGETVRQVLGKRSVTREVSHKAQLFAFSRE